MSPRSSAADPSAEPIPQPVRREAAAWLLALQSSQAGEKTLAEWRRWRAAHPDHERAWQRIERFEGKLQMLSSPLAHATLAMPDSPRRRRALQKLAVLLLAGGAVWAARDEAAWRSWMATHRTGVAQRDSVTLADGSTIDLNADTAVDVLFTDTQRLLRLRRGAVLITTAPDPQVLSGKASRPFIVQTSQGRARAIGTRYIVSQLDGERAGQSLITVLEGIVEVTLENGQTRRVAMGEQLGFTAEHIGEPESAPEGADAWSQGMIVAHEMPLQDFLAALSRHRPGRLACDPEIARLKVSGTYPLADTDRVLEILQATLPVRVHTLSRYWVTLHPDRPT